MAFTTADFVKETSTTTGTGTYTLAGASTGFRTFVSGIGNGNSCWYSATDGVDWEVGIGTVTDAASDTLSRDTILSSSNGGSAVNWGAGTRVLRVTLPASVITAKGLSNMQVFTTVGANTWSNNLTVGGSIIVECIGGGGGGASGGTGSAAAGTGGGAGGYCRKRIAASALGSTETVTVGSGGAGGVSGGGNAGTAGGSTTFGSHCTACGGAGGLSGAAIVGQVGGSGGLATSGDINIQGGDGDAGGNLGVSGGVVGGTIIGGDGGDSVYGFGGQGSIRATWTGATAVAGFAGHNYGGGGASALGASASSAAGGAGAQGVVIVWEFS